MASPKTNKNNSEVIINVVPELIVDDQPWIYKVPDHLRKLKEEAYTPKYISIGPFHSNNPELKKTGKKLKYFSEFSKRLNSHPLAMDKFKAYLKENEQTIKDSYFELDEHYKCEKDNDFFVDMILYDSVFIMELFLRNSERNSVKKDEPEKYKDDIMFTISWICKAIRRDLLLLENQIPLFVLEKLYNSVLHLLRGDDDDDGDKKKFPETFIGLAFYYFEFFYRQKKDSDITHMTKNYKTRKHFTDLIRYTYLPEIIQNSSSVDPKSCFTSYRKIKQHHIPTRTAKKLNEAGISFVKVQGKSYLDIKFQKTPILSLFLCLGFLPFTKYLKVRLEFPQLHVNQTTECVLRNLIALEQCHYSDQPFVCNYVSLIDSLIHTGEDVELLVDNEVIVHDLGSHKELARLVNSLCTNVEVSSNYYGKIIKKLNRHYDNGWMSNMGRLKSVYFRDPWRISSTVVGVVVFLFAIFNFLKLIRVFNP
ncbi:hypothetical protein PIB30_061139 [Stylosanthes scabra]|uniref:Uncharacterized protein n=1 Tax=Stylosanthes scabra TaxID=79078 RepID=A0ABU6SL80_9FABA|nr:hypothetical protein [Stylosanthes scabra]